MGLLLVGESFNETYASGHGPDYVWFFASSVIVVILLVPARDTVNSYPEIARVYKPVLHSAKPWFVGQADCRCKPVNILIIVRLPAPWRQVKHVSDRLSFRMTPLLPRKVVNFLIGRMICNIGRIATPVVRCLQRMGLSTSRVMDSRFTVFLVDDDERVLKALSRLLKAKGYDIRPFTSAQEYLEQHDPSIPGCAVLDVSMPGLDGLALQQILAAGDIQRPIIFLTVVKATFPQACVP